MASQPSRRFSKLPFFFSFIETEVSIFAPENTSVNHPGRIFVRDYKYVFIGVFSVNFFQKFIILFEVCQILSIGVSLLELLTTKLEK